jgi:hypothetical protein
MLLVEIKRSVQVHNDWTFINVYAQIGQQAHHAFKSFTTVNTLGVIIAVGGMWMYREFERDAMRVSQSRSEREDSTFTLSSDSYGFIPRKYQPVERLLGNKGYVHLQGAESDEALKAVQKRLRALNL